MSLSQFVVSFLVGYITSWQLSLVLTAMLPLIGLGGFFMAKAMNQGSVKSRTYEQSGGLAEEILSKIRTIASFANFEYEISRYNNYISASLKAGIKVGFKTGMGIGFIIFIVYCSYSLAVGYGTYLISSQTVNTNSGEFFGAGDVITVLFSIIFGCFALGQGAPNIKAMYEASVAAGELFALREQKQNSMDSIACEKPDKDLLTGILTFNSVNFSYPPRKKGDLPNLVLNNLNMVFDSGKKYAIVGASGCGKSTILSLIERFYEPDSGQILFDNFPIRNIEMKYWRNLIGYVPQEPVLFNKSIKDNIIFDRPDISQEYYNTAIEKAHLTELINKLGGDNYMVGIKGEKLSGGERQRIAIARAIITRPKLLILDEATSALDNELEEAVQKAIDTVSDGITTIIIAHKLDTIKNSDKIYVMSEVTHTVVESGTHEELLNIEGKYSELVKAYENSKIQRENKEPEEEINYEYAADDVSNHDPNQHNRLRKMSKDQVDIDAINIDIRASNSPPLDNLNNTYKSHNKISFSTHKEIKKESYRNSGKEFKLDKESSKKDRNDNSSIIKRNKNSENQIDPKYFAQSRKKLFYMLKNNKGFVAGGGIAAACNGAIWPIYGILLADAIGVLSQSKKEDVSEGGLNVSMMFLGLAIVAGIVLCLQNYFFYGIGEILTKKFRELVFAKYLNFHIGFFDRTENTPGSLLAKLSSDTTKINGVALTIIGQLIQTSVTLILGISLAMIYQWKLCLINICFMPLIIGNYIIQFKIQKGSNNSNESVEIESSSILSESVVNTKTIFSYNYADKVVEHYGNVITKGHSRNLYKMSTLVGIFYALSQFVIFGMYATLFYVGGGLYVKGEVTLTFMMRAIFIILFSALGVGVAQAFVGDYNSAKQAIVSLYKILDEPSLIDITESEKNGLKNMNIQGKIEFKDVEFAYPTEKNKKIFNKLNFTIYPGQTVAFVGSSGGGKSTILSLIERFYDVDKGNVLIDDVDIREYDLKLIRKQIGTVLQMPILFSGGLTENIRYGRLNATDEESYQAAKEAQIEHHINTKNVLSDQVSGGERQRIAIARAILKNPKILLLDEATSALDTATEKAVKESLDKLMVNRTSIVIAHR